MTTLRNTISQQQGVLKSLADANLSLQQQLAPLPLLQVTLHVPGLAVHLVKCLETNI